MRESRVRGGAASWPSLAAVAVCGGLQECNLAARVGWEAWADSPAIACALATGFNARNAGKVVGERRSHQAYVSQAQ